MRELGEFVRAKRDERGWSQVKLAKVAGISKATVSQIEAGFHIHPRPETLERIGKALKVSYELLDRLARGLSSDQGSTQSAPQTLETVSLDLYSQVQRLPIPQKDRDGLAIIVEKYLERYD